MNLNLEEKNKGVQLEFIIFLCNIDKIYIQFQMCCTLCYQIEFNHLIILSNEAKIVLSFSRIIKFNHVIH